MPFDKGFNFRLTSGYVTDGANETYVLAEAYPVTRNGVTFGWLTTTNLTGVDRDNAVDRRLAGVNYVQQQTDGDTFQVDLPATGAYLISIANGDTGAPQNAQYVEVFDNTTSKIILDNASVAQDTYIDATNVNRTEANWPTQNVASQQSFATVTFKLHIGINRLGYTVISHLFVSQVVAAPTTLMGQALL